MFKASVITGQTDYPFAYQQLMTWLNDVKSPDTALFEVMQSNESFMTAVTTWETKNMVLIPRVRQPSHWMKPVFTKA